MERLLPARGHVRGQHGPGVPRALPVRRPLHQRAGDRAGRAQARGGQPGHGHRAHEAVVHGPAALGLVPHLSVPDVPGGRPAPERLREGVPGLDQEQHGPVPGDRQGHGDRGAVPHGHAPHVAAGDPLLHELGPGGHAHQLRAPGDPAGRGLHGHAPHQAEAGAQHLLPPDLLWHQGRPCQAGPHPAAPARVRPVPRADLPQHAQGGRRLVAAPGHPARVRPPGLRSRHGPALGGSAARAGP